MDVEFITKGGKPYALIPAPDYYSLIEQSEMRCDIAFFDAAKDALESGDDEAVPLSLLKKQMAGEPPLKLWREYRGLTQDVLAKTANVSRSLIANIEAGHKQGSLNTLKKLSAALKVDLGDLA